MSQAKKIKLHKNSVAAILIAVLVMFGLIALVSIIQPSQTKAAPSYSGSYGPISTIALNDTTANGVGTIQDLDPNDHYGSAIANLGDYDSNGYDDLVIGACDDGSQIFGTTDSGEGAIYIHFMDAGGAIDSTVRIDADTANGPDTAPGFQNGDSYGCSVAVLNDIDSNGYPEIAVGAPDDEDTVGPTASWSGAVYLHFMEAGGAISSTVKFDRDTANGAGSVGTLDTFDYYGTSLANVGDIDGNGHDELAVGARSDEGEVGGSNGSGAFYIHFMEAGGAISSTVKIDEDTPNGFASVDTNLTSNAYGYSLANMGDFDGNGYNEIAVGSPVDNGEITATQLTNSGTVYLHFMGAGGTVLSTQVIDQDTEYGYNSYWFGEGQYFGYSLANIGDIDGNGYNDMAVGAKFADGTYKNRYNSAGAAYIVHLDADGSPLYTSHLSIDSENGAKDYQNFTNGGNYGTSVGTLGDINGDSIIDLIVGCESCTASGSTNQYTGQVFIHLLGQSPKLLSVSTSYPSGDYGKDFVFPLVATFSENLAAGSEVSLQLNTEETYITLNNVSGSTITGSYTVERGHVTPALNVADINYMNAIADDNGVNEQNTQLVYNVSNIADSKTLNIDGGPANIEINARKVSTDELPDLDDNDYYGHFVVNMGDLNDDGISDIAVSAEREEGDIGQTDNTGAIYFHMLDTDGSFKKTTRIDQDNTHIKEVGGLGAYGGTFFGYSIVNMGDLDGNGYNDIISGNGANSVSQQQLFVIYLGKNGVPIEIKTINSTTPNGPGSVGTIDANDFYGGLIENIGDIDGNGTPDIAVSAIADEGEVGGSSSSGAVYIHLLESDGDVISSYKISEDDPVIASIGSLEASDRFGADIEALGDIDQDGTPDIAVSATLDEGLVGDTSTSGTVYILFLNSDGSPKSTYFISEDHPQISAYGTNLGSYGSSIKNLGDIDNNGTIDIAVGASQDNGVSTDITRSGAVYIHLLNKTGAPLSTNKLSADTTQIMDADTLETNDGYGAGIQLIGDIDGNGVRDIAVYASAAEGDDTGIYSNSSSTGTIYIHTLDESANLLSTINLSKDDNNLEAAGLAETRTQFFGGSIASINDINGDGADDMVVGAYFDSDDGNINNPGAIYILSITQNIFNPAGYPVLSGFKSSSENGTYQEGETIKLRAIYDRELASGSSIIVNLNTGAQVTLSTVDGNLLKGNYIVGSGETTTSLEVTSIVDSNAINLDGSPVTVSTDISAVGYNVDDFSSIAIDGSSTIDVHEAIIFGETSTNGPANLDASDLFGENIEYIGDLDGNTYPDLLIGSEADEYPAGVAGSGVIRTVLMGANSEILSIVAHGEGSDSGNGPIGLGYGPGEGYGSNFVYIDDFNGSAAVLAGAPLDSTIGHEGGATTDAVGAVHLSLMDTSGNFTTSYKYGEATTNGATDGTDQALDETTDEDYGKSVLWLDDIDGAGSTEGAIAVGASKDEVEGSATSSGVVYTHLLNSNGTVDSTNFYGKKSRSTPDNEIAHVNRLSDGSFLIGGYFSNVGNTARSSFAKIDSDGVLDATFGSVGTNDAVFSSGVQGDGKIIIGGDFTSVEGNAISYIARVTSSGSFDGTFNDPSINGGVYDIAIQPDDKIIIGGDFALGTHNYIARLNADGTVDATFGTNGTNGVVYDIDLLASGKMYIAGDFTDIESGSHTVPGVARLNADGTPDTAFDPSNAANMTFAGGGYIYQVEVQSDDKVIAAGNFSVSETVTPGNVYNVVRMDDTGEYDPYIAAGNGFDSGDEIYSMKLQSDGKLLLVGYIYEFAGNGLNDYNGAFVRLNTDGTIDDTFNPDTGFGYTTDYIGTAIAIDSSDRVIIGSYLSGVSDYDDSYLERFSSTGSLDTTFGVPSDGIPLNDPNNGENYGYSMANISDLDGNGVNDIAVGAPSISGAGYPGAVFLHTIDTDGSFLETYILDRNTVYEVSLLGNTAQYGYKVTNVGDIDSNGYDDIAVTAINATNKEGGGGAVYLHLLGEDGAIVDTISVEANSQTQSFGYDVAGLGDINGDSIPDIVVGDPDYTDGSSGGAIFIYNLNSDGSNAFKYTFFDENSLSGLSTVESGDKFGSSVSAFGDLDGDSINEIIVGASNDEYGATSNAGAFYALFFNAAGTVNLVPTSLDKYGVITLTPTNSLDIAITPNLTDFIVSKNNQDYTPDSVSVAANLVTIDTGLSLTYADLVEVSYIPTTNPLRDTDGIKVSPLVRSSINNNLEYDSSTSSASRKTSVTQKQTSIAAAIQASESGVEPAGNPVLLYSEVSGNTLSLVFNKRIKETSVPQNESFTVLVNETNNPVTSVKINNSVVSLILKNRVSKNDTVSLSYDSRDDNPLEDTDDQNVDSLEEITVTNNSGNSDLVAPIPIQAVRTDNTEITWYFNELLDQNVPDTEDFTILANKDINQPVTKVSISGNQVILEYFNRADSIESLSLTYQKGTDVIRDLSFNEIKNTFSYPVTSKLKTTKIDIDPNDVIISEDQNQDGIADVLQDNVMTTLSPTLPVPFTMEVKDDNNQCESIENFSIIDENDFSTQDQFEFPFGLIQNGVSCKESGVTATFCIQIPLDLDPDSFNFRKYNEEEDSFSGGEDLNLTVENVSKDGLTSTRLCYEVTDGGPYDLDGTVDGNISDPVGIGVDPQDENDFILTVEEGLISYQTYQANQSIEEKEDTLESVSESTPAVVIAKPPLPIQAYKLNDSQVIVEFSQEIKSRNLYPGLFILTTQDAKKVVPIDSVEIHNKQIIIDTEEDLVLTEKYELAYVGRTITNNQGIPLDFFSNLTVLQNEVTPIVEDEEIYLHNDGDGNGNGISDDLESNVVTVVNPITNTSITIESDRDSCRQNQYFSISDSDSVNYQDDEYIYPLGLIRSSFFCSKPGETATFSLYLPFKFDTSNWVYRKVGENGSQEMPATFSTVTLAGGPNAGAEVTKITFKIKDGGAFDEDGSANGVIVDPSGPGILKSIVEKVTINTILRPAISKSIAEAKSVSHLGSDVLIAEAPVINLIESTEAFGSKPIADVKISEEYKNILEQIPGVIFSDIDESDIKKAYDSPRFDQPVSIFEPGTTDSIILSMNEEAKDLICNNIPRQSLDRGDYNSPEAAWVQRISNLLYGTDLLVDSNYGRRTKKAVLQIQKSLGFFLPLGNWSERTWNALIEKIDCN